jgi:hypothetical protein
MTPLWNELLRLYIVKRWRLTIRAEGFVKRSITGRLMLTDVVFHVDGDDQGAGYSNCQCLVLFLR